MYCKMDAFNGRLFGFLYKNSTFAVVIRSKKCSKNTNINFFLVDSQKDKTSVQAIVRHKGKRYAISIGESVVVKYWNKKNHRCRVVREYPDSAFINQRIDEWEKMIENIFNNFGLVIPTVQMVKDAVKKEINKINVESGGISTVDEKQLLVKFAERFKKECNFSLPTQKEYGI